MKDQELLNHLLDLARRLGFEVRTDQGPFRDGQCRLNDKRIIILNRASSSQRKVAALGLALRACSLEGLFLLPAVRQALEEGFGIRAARLSGDSERESTLHPLAGISPHLENKATNPQPSFPQEA